VGTGQWTIAYMCCTWMLARRPKPRVEGHTRKLRIAADGRELGSVEKRVASRVTTLITWISCVKTAGRPWSLSRMALYVPISTVGLSPRADST
jgi:hypothetical protein